MRLFDAYEKKIYAVALLILEDQTQAEDAAQQTWLKLVQNWERISALPWKETGGYVVTTAKNAALDILRVERKTTAFPENWEPPAWEDSQPEYNYLVEEQTNREIAHRLHINESTVAVRILRGKSMLRECLEKEGYIYDTV